MQGVLYWGFFFKQKRRPLKRVGVLYSSFLFTVYCAVVLVNAPARPALLVAHLQGPDAAALAIDSEGTPIKGQNIVNVSPAKGGACIQRSRRRTAVGRNRNVRFTLGAGATESPYGPAWDGTILIRRISWDNNVAGVTRDAPI